MKLTFFRIDEKFAILYKYVQLHKKEAVLIIKKHPLFLASSVLLFLLSVVLYGLHVYITFFLINNRELTVIAIPGIFLFIARCSLLLFYFYPRSFNVSRVILGTELDLLHQQSLLFKKHTARGIRCIILLGIDILITLLFEFFLLTSSRVSATFIILDIGIVLLLLFCIYWLLKRHIDFEMDFVVITPDTIHFFDQNGFFTYTNIVIATKQVTNIQFQQQGWIENIFNIGSLSVLSFSPTYQSSLVQFSRIGDVLKTEEMIRTIIILQ